MHRGFLGALALTVLSGCVQATRHSNTMLFGTNTTFGIKAGTTTGQIPEVVVGYDRQEAVILPLVANTSQTEDQSRMVPCDVGEAVDVNGGTGFPVHPCLFVATNKQATDAYSVLASFGADFGGSVDGNSPTVKGGLAQYFATGMAAQMLALSGGASVVNSNGQPGTANAAAVEALFGTEEQRTRAVQFANNYGNFKTLLRGKIANDGDDATMIKNLSTFETRIAAKSKLSDRCSTKTDCLTILDSSGENPFANLFRTNEKMLTDEIGKWGQ